ncbi:hypothetical protein ANCDUO_00936 [Ancylostoma duodenale]|uniref:PLAT domain-containing protein n=1 Tax=Ancylostoma duodenale TaxID=51022 RepID=A0A0C2HGI8_9BILA|nr:hypothetical protein ANCDUO_00936 [Ancylostoma duodenale]
MKISGKIGLEYKLTHFGNEPQLNRAIIRAALVLFRWLNLKIPEDGRVWDVVIATCDEPGAGTDASVYLKPQLQQWLIYYESAHEYETFNLDNPGRDDFERGAKDHFKLFFKQGDIINMGLFWWPGFTFSQSWCAKWVGILLNTGFFSFFELYSELIVNE